MAKSKPKRKPKGKHHRAVIPISVIKSQMRNKILEMAEAIYYSESILQLDQTEINFISKCIKLTNSGVTISKNQVKWLKRIYINQLKQKDGKVI